MNVIYVDSLFLMNLVADYLLLLCTARLCALQLKRKRYLLSAVLGSLYAVITFMPDFNFLSAPVYKLLFGGLMGFLAFGSERKPIRCIAVFLMLSAAVGGLFWAIWLSFGTIELNFKLFIFCFALFYALLRFISSRSVVQADKALAQMELHMAGRHCAFTVLVDSGNCLADPATGEKAAIVCPHAVGSLFPDAFDLTADPVAIVSQSPKLPELIGRLRLLSYSSLGGSGLIWAFRPDAVYVDGKERKGLLIAVSQSACGADFEGII